MSEMTKLAEHILWIAGKKDNKITNLQLQKILFFTIGLFIRKNQEDRDLLSWIENIYDENFEKWRYGPVIPSVYFTYNDFGRSKIEDKGLEYEKFCQLNELIELLIKIDVFELVELSHKLPAWKNHEEAILGRKPVSPYSFEEIYDDFTA